MREKNKVNILEEKHLISILLFIAKNNECNKGAIYRNISTNPRIPEKLNLSEREGLIEQRKGVSGSRVTLCLTQKGRLISESLGNMDRIMNMSNFNGKQ